MASLLGVVFFLGLILSVILALPNVALGAGLEGMLVAVLVVLGLVVGAVAITAKERVNYLIVLIAIVTLLGVLNLQIQSATDFFKLLFGNLLVMVGAGALIVIPFALKDLAGSR